MFWVFFFKNLWTARNKFSNHLILWVQTNPELFLTYLKPLIYEERYDGLILIILYFFNNCCQSFSGVLTTVLAFLQDSAFWSKIKRPGPGSTHVHKLTFVLFEDIHDSRTSGIYIWRTEWTLWVTKELLNSQDHLFSKWEVCPCTAWWLN